MILWQFFLSGHMALHDVVFGRCGRVHFVHAPDATGKPAIAYLRQLNDGNLFSRAAFRATIGPSARRDVEILLSLSASCLGPTLLFSTGFAIRQTQV